MQVREHGVQTHKLLAAAAMRGCREPGLNLECSIHTRTDA
jgi:hypothetical protein